MEDYFINEILLGLEVVYDILPGRMSYKEQQKCCFAFGVFCDLMHLEAEAIFDVCWRDSSFKHGAPLGRERIHIFFKWGF